MVKFFEMLGETDDNVFKMTGEGAEHFMNGDADWVNLPPEDQALLLLFALYDSVPERDELQREAGLLILDHFKLMTSEAREAFRVSLVESLRSDLGFHDRLRAARVAVTASARERGAIH